MSGKAPRYSEADGVLVAGTLGRGAWKLKMDSND